MNCKKFNSVDLMLIDDSAISKKLTYRLSISETQFLCRSISFLGSYTIQEMKDNTLTLLTAQKPVNTLNVLEI